MYRRKVIVTASAIFAIGVAFAAQTTTPPPQPRSSDVQSRDPWVPGANMLISAHETGAAPLLPPR